MVAFSLCGELEVVSFIFYLSLMDSHPGLVVTPDQSCSPHSNCKQEVLGKVTEMPKFPKGSSQSIYLGRKSVGSYGSKPIYFLYPGLPEHTQSVG